MNNEVLFKNLRNLRKSYELTQEEVAEIVGKDRSLIAKYESGKAVPPLNILRIFSRLYNVSVDSLCGETEDESKGIVLNDESKSADKDRLYYLELSDVEREIIRKLRVSGEDKINEIYESLGDLL